MDGAKFGCSECPPTFIFLTETGGALNLESLAAGILKTVGAGSSVCCSDLATLRCRSLLAMGLATDLRERFVCLANLHLLHGDDMKHAGLQIFLLRIVLQTPCPTEAGCQLCQL